MIEIMRSVVVIWRSRGECRHFEPAVLASNMRTTGRYADCTYSHSGNFVDLEKMRSAVNAAAAYLGLRIAVNTGSHFD
ncbi:hypothetical protein ACQGAO_18450 [Rhodococcus sp. 1.20]